MDDQPVFVTSGKSAIITYIGVGFILFGTFLVLVTATSPFSLLMFTSLGGFIVAMGVVLSCIGLREKNSPIPEEASWSSLLAHIDWELEESQEATKKTNGNRAFGFVLIPLGLFTTTAAGVLMFLLWPVALFGIGCLAAGAILFCL